MTADRRVVLAGGLAAALLLSGAAVATAAPQRVGDAVLEPVPLRELPGFPGPDPGAALLHLRAVCGSRLPAPVSYPVADLDADLARLCRDAASLAPEEAATFFATRFDAFRILRPANGTVPERRTGFLTGYFEPELDGALERSAAYPVAVLGRPDDLVSFQTGESPAGLDPALRAARRVGDRLEAYPDRASIEDGTLGDKARPLLFLRDAVDLFVLQVQGSGRVRLPDGRSVRVLYDGRNGRPYTSIAKLIVAEGHLPLEGLTLARWTGWLRDHPEDGRRLMRANASYIFFRLEEVADPALGPPGAAKAPLVPGRSLAVDAGLWPYGTVFWLEGRLPGAGREDRGRLVVAADTGSAIVGPARGDLFVGTGAQAGAVAGDLRDAVGFVVLLPKRGAASP
ncbi:murein transglycosylase A [Methylobacterium sp. sgz302541]|uniref:murein transglycosylase A n=1 Tax=unclassified Methylobacterium TaxID=2615210 RepID=UPI003D32F45A